MDYSTSDLANREPKPGRILSVDTFCMMRLLMTFVFTGLLVCVVFSTAPASESGNMAARVQSTCTACHDMARVCQHMQSFAEQEWRETVERMDSHGAQVGDDVALFATFLAGPESSQSLDCGQAGEQGVPFWTTAALSGHPLLMSASLLLAFWVFSMGLQRARFSHFGVRARFKWKEHVRYGEIVLALWLLGMGAGSLMTHLFQGGVGVTGEHFDNALRMLPLIIIGGATGLYMDRNKNPQRTVLPAIHGVNNTILLALACYQAWLGMWIAVGIVSF